MIVNKLFYWFLVYFIKNLSIELIADQSGDSPHLSESGSEYDHVADIRDQYGDLDDRFNEPAITTPPCAVVLNRLSNTLFNSNAVRNLGGFQNMGEIEVDEEEVMLDVAEEVVEADENAVAAVGDEHGNYLI